MPGETALQRIKKEKEKKTGKLNLSYLGLNEIPKEILELDQLQSLDLSNNQIFDYSFLGELGKLQYLDLSYNQISDIRCLGKLGKLQYLDLRNNQISDIRCLEKLGKLQSLYLRNNQISDIRCLGKLGKLQSLDLRNNQISDIRCLGKLGKLQSLYLRNNQISDIRFLEKLGKLQSLDLRNNQISDIRCLEKLGKLQSLDLSNNQISDYSFLGKLGKLQSLYLRNNQISDYSFLEKLEKLQYLDLSHNQISDYSFLEKLEKLQYLYLSNNQISDIRFLEKLEKLQSLDLSHNQISDIESLLTIIRLGKMKVSIEEYDIYQKLNLYNNPIIHPPIETVAQGNEAIIKHFKDIAQQGIDYLYEAKLLIIGDGGAGKTSLAWKMKDLAATMPEEGNDRTKGIDIQALPIQNMKNAEKPFLMNVWDFGGQGYYHSTHQFFLTKRSLYIIVNNTLINKTDFNHWLQTVSVFSDNSPIIIVENEVAKVKSELDLRGLQQHFDNILYVRAVDISNTADGRLQKLIADIEIEVQRLPHVGMELPKQWVKIRADLAKVAESAPYISDKEFYKICRKHQITKKEAIKRLGDLFHDLGIFLHFRNDEVLKQTVILQNTWATKGVYEILDSNLVRNQAGYFNILQAETIWDNTEFEDMHHELVRLMTKFELCYRIPYINTPTAYISPNLLATEKPIYDWDNHQNLIIYYQYEFMPKGLLGRLIVRLHRHVKDIQHLAWRNGCIFEYEETEAQVVETYGLKKLEIRVQGKHCVRLSSIIIREIDELNEGFKRIKVKKKFPCNCTTCSKSNEPHFYDYANLMNRKAKGKSTVECDKSFDDVLVRQILEGVYNAKDAKELSPKELIIEGKIREAIDVFEQDYPYEGTLLLSMYNRNELLYHLRQITSEDWEVKQQQVANSLLSLSKRPPKVAPVQASLTPGLTDMNNNIKKIQQQLEGQNAVLYSIIEKSSTNQQELLALLNNIENNTQNISADLELDIMNIIQKGMNHFESHFQNETTPNIKEIISDWQAASQQLKLAVDSKTKLKLMIPFLFLRFEKELAWNGKDWFRAIREDVKRGVKGNWSEMFLEHV